MYHSDCFKFGLTVKQMPFKRKCYLVLALRFSGRIAQSNYKCLINPHNISVRKTGADCFGFDNILGEVDYITISL